MDTFAERMKEAMRIRGLKQIDIVEKTKIGKSAISQYLSGICEPKQKNIYKIAQALNVNEAWLMGYNSTMERDKLSIPINLDNFSNYLNFFIDKYRKSLNLIRSIEEELINKTDKTKLISKELDEIKQSMDLLLNEVMDICKRNDLYKLNDLGQEKVHDYIFDLLENVKYIDK